MNSNEDILGKAMMEINNLSQPDNQIESEFFSLLQNGNSDSFSCFEEMFNMSGNQPEPSDSVESLSSSPACFETNSGNQTDQSDDLSGKFQVLPDTSGFNKDSFLFESTSQEMKQEIYEPIPKKACISEGLNNVRFIYFNVCKIFMINVTFSTIIISKCLL